MTSPGIDSRLLEALHRASNLELFQLNAVIERMLADPKRIVQVRKDLHLGQTVRFMDWRDGQMRTGNLRERKRQGRPRQRQLRAIDATHETWTSTASASASARWPRGTTLSATRGGPTSHRATAADMPAPVTD